MSVVLGRDAERARIDALLEAARRGRTGTLVFAGEPGMGKTALLDDACARASGMRILRLTASEAESSLPFAGLDALLRPLRDLLPRVEAPQERALRVALALAEGESPDVLAVNAGTLALLAEAAAERPVLVAVDDAHWLDGPTAGALTFAARRLEGEDIAFLVTARTGEASAFDRGFERVDLEALPSESARDLLERRREPVPPGAAERMLELAAGNPLALLELPVSLATGAPGAAATAPDRLRNAFAERLETLSEASRLALVVAAADPDPVAVRRAVELLGLAGGDLSSAERAGLVRVETGRLAFRHPLVRSLAYASVGSEERRAVHRALARALNDEADRDRRAWHLAAAAVEPDDELADLLEETADRAEARGGHAAAARALERSARLSTDSDARARRLTQAGRLAFWAGEPDRGCRLAEEAIDGTTDANLRADALLELASIRGAQTTGYIGMHLQSLQETLDQLDADRAAWLLLSLSGRVSSSLDSAAGLATAGQLVTVSRLAGAWWRPRGLMAAAGQYLAAGDTRAFDDLLAEVGDDPAAIANCAIDLVWAERYELARRCLDSTLRDGRTAGNRMRIIWNQVCLAILELRFGRLAPTVAAASEAVALAETHGIANWGGIARGALAGAHAWRGDADACRVAATEAIAAAREADSLLDELAARSALALLAVGLGRMEEAIDEVEALVPRWRMGSHVEPSAVPFVPDLVEAYARSDERPRAEELLGRFRAAAEHVERKWALAAVARCEGILAGAEAFADPFERSLRLLAESPLQLERARTQLAYGERLRRAGQRRAARTHLRAAHEAFAAVDAVPWAERAAAELRATGESVGPRTPDRRAQLTPQELQIAQLVGEGKTNKEIAAQLYLSPKTIEYHLANAYRKLGIHSRVELARVVTAT